ncbi:MAG: tetratricopeptide repeat protein, partial [Anaerolineae bacterium]|nr:tetratricopeptide repeat protein [Anaerolineae bacterium]
GRQQEALTQFQRAVEAAPMSGQAYVALGDWHWLQADREAAERAYQKAIEIAPADPSGYISLGQA